MDKYIFKKIRDNMPDSLKYVTASLIRNHLIKNEHFQNFFAFLNKRSSFSDDFVQEYQFSQLKEMLRHANNYVPYYSKVFKKAGFNPEKMNSFYEIQKIPYLTKDLVKKNYSQLISTKKVKGGYYFACTGGTSDLPMNFLLDYKSVFIENAFIYSYRQKLGYKLSDKLITFRWGKYQNGFCKINPMHNEKMLNPFNLSRSTFKNYLVKIRAYKPAFLHGYLSSIYYLAQLMNEYNIQPDFQVKGIFFVSETINDDQRKFVEEYFGAPSTTFYGHSERSVIAPEMERNAYHFDPLYGYTELVANGSETKTIAGTGFLNQTMPLIRYVTDDECVENESGYKIYGKRSSALGLIGRNHELITQPGFDLRSKTFKNILQSQLIQNNIGKATLCIIPNKAFQQNEISGIKKELHCNVNGLIDFEVELVDKLILSPRGKHIDIINNLKNTDYKKIINHTFSEI
jgi:phenylacetate-CoA ligase